MTGDIWSFGGFYTNEEVTEGISLCAWPVMELQLGKSWNTSCESLGRSVAKLRAQAQPKGPNMHSQQQTGTKDLGLLGGTKVLACRLDTSATQL